MAAQNEIGNVYPVRVVADAVAPVPVLCDAVQAFGKLPLSVADLGAALVVVSSHKIGGPPGAGALWTRLDLRPLLAGGPQERGRRAGTENVPALVGFGVAAAALPERLAAMPRVAALRDRLERELLARVPGLRVHGDREARLPNTLSFRVDGLEGDLLLAALDLEGIRLSSGSACSSGSVEPSPVLRALGLDEAAARGGLRASLGPETTDAEIDRLLDLLPALAARARAAA
jgi:cysteine desulfurase